MKSGNLLGKSKVPNPAETKDEAPLLASSFRKRAFFLSVAAYRFVSLFSTFELLCFRKDG